MSVINISDSSTTFWGDQKAFLKCRFEYSTILINAVGCVSSVGPFGTSL